ncbi:dimethyl sulfoxide reductase anchor subunit [Providencia rettgeri]|nr:dimethyl sulfoxide reductase anchor subunit [Providencia rettgeri]
MNEWPLLLFTFLMQTSIGLSVMLALFAKNYQRLYLINEYTILQQYVFCCLCICGVGLLSSITHLGVLLNAPNSLLNIFHRGCREVVFHCDLFCFSWADFLWLWFKRNCHFCCLVWLSLLGCDVYAMASIIVIHQC